MQIIPTRIIRRTPIAIRAAALFAASIALLAAGAARADQLPLWELGAGAAVVNFPDYRGSDERRTYPLPVPYVIYRGETLRIDRQKVRGLLFETSIAELDVSASGSVQVKSDKNRARRGMPDLDPTLELGPSLNIFLYRNPTGRSTLELRLPLRAIIASDFRQASYEGLLFNPHLNLDLRGVFPGPGWNLGLQVGPIFATRQYHDYFYGVAPPSALPERPAYQAKGGYSGTQSTIALSKRFQNYWFGAFVKADSLHGAVFEDSPLLKKKYAISAGVAAAYVFARSGRLVEARD